MTHDQAIATAAREAMEMLMEVGQEGEGEVLQILNVIDSVIAGLSNVAAGLQAEEPTADQAIYFLREARVSAAGALIIFALFPGTKALPCAISDMQ